MKKIVFACSMIFISSCDGQAQSNIFFTDDVGHSAIFFSEDFKKYGYSTVGGNIALDQKFVNCSTKQRICFKGPFLLNIENNDLKDHPIQVNSSDNEKSCKFHLKLGQNNELGIASFRCEYRNGAPSPEYIAMEIEPNGAMRESVLVFSRIPQARLR